MLGASALMADELVIPGHGGSYDSARGYWFTSPCDFDITGLRVPTGASDSLEQSIQIVKMDGPWDPYPTETTAFTNLGYWSRVSSYDWIDTDIAVNTGDLIGIMGMRGGLTDYGPYSGENWDTTICGDAVELWRFGYQGSIFDAAAPNVWRELVSDYYIGRIEMRYECDGGGGGNGSPELSTWMLLACSGLAGLAFRRRRS